METSEPISTTTHPTTGRLIGLRVLYFLLGLSCGVTLTFVILIALAAAYGVSY